MQLSLSRNYGKHHIALAKAPSNKTIKPTLSAILTKMEEHSTSKSRDATQVTKSAPTMSNLARRSKILSKTDILRYLEAFVSD